MVALLISEADANEWIAKELDNWPTKGNDRMPEKHPDTRRSLWRSYMPFSQMVPLHRDSSSISDHTAIANLHSHDPTMVVSNVIGLAKAAKIFNVPTILTTVVEDRGGKLIKGLQDVFPDQKSIDPTFINTWEHQHLGGRAGRRCGEEDRANRSLQSSNESLPARAGRE
jgi:hypothetical protein